MDYLDGKLGPEELSMLHDFLSQNPDLEAELQDISADVPQISYREHKLGLSLKKEIVQAGHIHAHNYEEAFIAFHENDLDEGDKKVLEKFLTQNPMLRLEFDAYGKLFVAHNGEHFPYKNKLKRRGTLIPLYRYAAAASVLLLLGLGVLRYGLGEPDHVASRSGGKVPLPSLGLVKVETSRLPMTTDTYPNNVSSPTDRIAATERRADERAIRLDIVERQTIPYTQPLMRLSSDVAPVALGLSKALPTDDGLSLTQVVGKVLENRVGENDVSESLKKDEKVTAADMVDLAAIPFKNAETPVLATTYDETSGKRRVRFNLGIFEADFALR